MSSKVTVQDRDGGTCEEGAPVALGISKLPLSRQSAGDAKESSVHLPGRAAVSVRCVFFI